MRAAGRRQGGGEHALPVPSQPLRYDLQPSPGLEHHVIDR